MFTPAMRGRDATLLKNCCGDFVQLCAHRRERGAKNQSVRRVKTSVAAVELTYPRDLERLVRIAEGLHLGSAVRGTCYTYPPGCGGLRWDTLSRGNNGACVLHPTVRD